MAHDVDGVTGVTNTLAVNASGEKRERVMRSDPEVREDVVKLLSRDAKLRDSEIAIESVQNGVVHLGGFAKSLDDQLHALRLTMDIAGVVAVRNDLKTPDNTVYDIDMGSGLSVGAIPSTASSARRARASEPTDRRAMRRRNRPGSYAGNIPMRMETPIRNQRRPTESHRRPLQRVRSSLVHAPARHVAHSVLAQRLDFKTVDQ